MAPSNRWRRRDEFANDWAANLSTRRGTGRVPPHALARYRLAAPVA
jgi:hypothetical protein